MKVHDADNGFVTLETWELAALERLQKILGDKPYYVTDVMRREYIGATEHPPVTHIRFVHGSDDI